MPSHRVRLFFGRLAQFISDLHAVESDLAVEAYDAAHSPLQHRLMQVLFFSGAKNLSALSECLDINLPNCSREVRKLTEKGFVEKTRSPSDARIVEVSLSVSGRAYTNSVMQSMMNAMLRRSGEWNDADLDACTEAIATLEERLVRRLR